MQVTRQSQRNSGESIGLFTFWAKGWIFGWFHFFGYYEDFDGNMIFK